MKRFFSSANKDSIAIQPPAFYTICQNAETFDNFLQKPKIFLLCQNIFCDKKNFNKIIKPDKVGFWFVSLLLLLIKGCQCVLKFHKAFYFIEKCVDVLELTVHGCVAHVCDFVHFFEPFHDKFSNVS